MALRELFVTESPSHFLNCAAYTAVDRAEDEKGLAHEINGKSVGILARLCKEFNVLLFHISTDYVFNGTATQPYAEDDPKAPIGVYGSSKLLGETEMLAEGGEGVILRTSWVYSFYGNNFVKTMIHLGKQLEEIKVVSDQVGSPTYARDIAEVLIKLCDMDYRPVGVEVYHYSNQGFCSWHEFAQEIMEGSSLSCAVRPISTAEYPTKAERPAYSVLDSTKFRRAFADISIPDWKTSLAHCIDRLKN